MRVSLWSALTAFRKRRALTAEEYAWAGDVFGATLPPRDRIGVSPAIGLQRRPFTFPLPGRRTTIFLGSHAADPVRTHPALFAHELTHVWQLAHARNRLVWLIGAVAVQLRHTLGKDVYDVGDATGSWTAYNVEQQAQPH